MKLTLLNLLSLLAFTSAVEDAETLAASKCPKKGDECLFEYDIVLVFGINEHPECWHKENEKWICLGKSEGTCSYDKRAMDVSYCKDYKPKAEKPSCPKVGEECQLPWNKNFNFGKSQIPPCWVKRGGDQVQCFWKVNGKCEHPETTLDVSTCKGYKP